MSGMMLWQHGGTSWESVRVGPSQWSEQSWSLTDWSQGDQFVKDRQSVVDIVFQGFREEIL